MQNKHTGRRNFRRPVPYLCTRVLILSQYMENSKSSNPHKSVAIEETNKVISEQKNRIVFHLFYTPVALLVFIGSFIYQCVVIPTSDQIIFCMVAMGISVLILKKTGRIIYCTLRNEEVSESSSYQKTNTIRKLIGYYAIYMVIAFTTIAAGACLNTIHLDYDKAASRDTHFELIFRLPSTVANSIHNLRILN